MRCRFENRDQHRQTLRPSASGQKGCGCTVSATAGCPHRSRKLCTPPSPLTLPAPPSPVFTVPAPPAPPPPPPVSRSAPPPLPAPTRTPLHGCWPLLVAPCPPPLRCYMVARWRRILRIPTMNGREFHVVVISWRPVPTLIAPTTPDLSQRSRLDIMKQFSFRPPWPLAANVPDPLLCAFLSGDSEVLRLPIFPCIGAEISPRRACPPSAVARTAQRWPQLEASRDRSVEIFGPQRSVSTRRGGARADRHEGEDQRCEEYISLCSHHHRQRKREARPSPPIECCGILRFLRCFGGEFDQFGKPNRRQGAHGWQNMRHRLHSQ